MKLIQRIGHWFSRKDQLEHVPRNNHKMSRKDISPNALKVLYRLQSSGYEAYLVGGCVRDILLGLHPKDFDVTTNATPEEVRNLFSNSRLIGRRFKLVHVTFGREMIEVATFRANHQTNLDHSASSQSKEGMLLRDNVYGTIDEDAMRRDFTVNAMYYRVKNFEIKALHHALDDLKNKRLRMIGDPAVRYREDPVRMLRAIRFAAKLDFEMDKATSAPIKEMAVLLRNIPAARLFDEALKLLLSGKGLITFKLLREYNLLEPLFPITHHHLTTNPDQWLAFIEQAVTNTDIRIKAGKPITPAFILAAFLWPEIKRIQEQLISEGVPAVPAMHQASQRVIQEQNQSIMIPKRFSLTMRDIWDLQLRLERRFGKKAEQTASHPKFRAGYDFLLLREQGGEDCSGLGQWWTEYQEANGQAKSKLMKDVDERPKRRKRRPPAHKRKPKNNES